MKKIINFPTKKLLNSKEYLDEYVSIKNILLKKVDNNELQKIINEILITTKNKKNFFSCGNGGSASTAEHLFFNFSFFNFLNNHL
jgi:D-sedoheptulose 7-phosphate isomerase